MNERRYGYSRTKITALGPQEIVIGNIYIPIYIATLRRVFKTTIKVTGEHSMISPIYDSLHPTPLLTLFSTDSIQVDPGAAFVLSLIWTSAGDCARDLQSDGL
jgi:hypothetical protein